MKKMLLIGITIAAVAFCGGFLVAKYYCAAKDNAESYSIYQVKMFSPWDGILRDHIIRLERNSGRAAFLSPYTENDVLLRTSPYGEMTANDQKYFERIERRHSIGLETKEYPRKRKLMVWVAIPKNEKMITWHADSDE